MPCRCEYVDCEVQRVYYPHVRMYRFPIRDDVRLEKWKTNCGNVRMRSLGKEKLKNKYICERHFNSESFINETKHRLTITAVPFRYKMIIKKKTFNSDEISTDRLKGTTNKNYSRLKLQSSTNKIEAFNSGLLSPQILQSTCHKISDEILKYKSAGNEYDIKNGSMPRPTIKQEIIENEESIHIPQEDHIRMHMPIIKEETEYLSESSVSPNHWLEPICCESAIRSITENVVENSPEAKKISQDDQYDIFGKFVASELRCGKSENLQKKIKLMIVKILLETTE